MYFVDVRKTDNLGRLSLPTRTRRLLGLAGGDEFEVFLEGDCIIVSKYKAKCVFCGNSEDIITFKSKSLCMVCKNNLGNL